MIIATEKQTKLAKWIKRLLTGSVTVALAMILIYQVIIYTGPSTKNEWLHKQATRLKSLTVTEDMIAEAKPWNDFGLGRKLYYRIHDEGVIPLGDGNWVYAVCHSWHANDFSGSNRSLWAKLTWRIRQLRRWLMGNSYQQPVGDAILAIDQKGQLYINEGHVCGDLQLVSEHPVATLDDFLRTLTQPEEVAWKQMK